MLLNPQNINRYSYVLNDPTGYMDPEGRDVVLPDPPERKYGQNFKLYEMELERYYDALDRMFDRIFDVRSAFPEFFDQYALGSTRRGPPERIMERKLAMLEELEQDSDSMLPKPRELFARSDQAYA